MKNAISTTIDSTEQQAQYDASVKRLLSEKIILAWILKECVTEFKPFSISQIVKDCIEGEPQISIIAVDPDELDKDVELAGTQIEGMNTEDNSVREGKIFYDIRFTAHVPGSKEPVQLIINIEAQKSSRTTYPLIKRAVYYVSRMISAQKNTVFTKSHYEKIRKVYSIWIQMNVDTGKENTITEYAIKERNVIGKVREPAPDYDLLTIVMIGLGKAEDAGDKPILKLLDVLLSMEKRPDEKKTILENDFNIPMSVSIDKEVNEMCNLGEGIAERTVQKTQADIVLHMVQNKNYSMDEALEVIGVSEDEKETIKGLVDSKIAVVDL